MAFKDRIKSLRRVRAGDLKANAKNWRTHPDEQRSAVTAVLEDVGWADAVIARELDDGTLEVIDGHLRAGLDPDAKIPVLIVDLTDEEADKVLATFDPITAMAEADTDMLRSLLDGLEMPEGGMKDLEEMLRQQYLTMELPAITDEFSEGARIAGGVAPPAPMPESGVRVVQLFFDINGHAEFHRLEGTHRARLGTTNATDTVLALMREAAKA